MDERGDNMAVPVIIAIVLGLVVLTIVILIFREQAIKGAEGFEDIRKGTGIEPSMCFNLIESKSCMLSTCPQGTSAVSGTWSDCQSKSTGGKRYVCCKKE